jgi:hypothetical protein
LYSVTTDTPFFPFLLDDVSVTDITPQAGSNSSPEPGTPLTMLGGVAAMALKLRRGRGSARSAPECRRSLSANQAAHANPNPRL